ncbi:hypothetical protein TBK1r_17460 [Stieleria magnilauensis]|uniref:Type II secretion system protein G n=2 Tax=Stieleria magnilauensis TaxID=2527963 RepID=A0ABX5XLF2_9BACT|nr:hypothetical protein TBK1r_17460 [Planctomycetes bacterium TBK1r]
MQSSQSGLEPMHHRKSHDRLIARSRRGKSRAFTLVELLVVMTVMVSLGGMLTYALASAQTDARIKRTQADVVTIGQLLQTRLSDVSLSKMNLAYGRTIPQLVRAGVLGTTALDGTVLTNPGSPQPTTSEYQKIMADEQARLILLARRDMLRMVMPECQRDLLYPPATLQYRTRAVAATSAAARTTNWYPNAAQLKPPAQWNQMRTLLGLYSAETIDFHWAGSPATDPEVDAIALAASNTDFDNLLRHNVNVPYTGPASATPISWTRQHESSECLFLILATTELFGKKAIDQIPTSRIKDTDGDGVPEILDAWDQPYVFVRNPVGFRSPAIANYDPTGATEIEQYPSEPDALDLLLVDFRFDTRTHPNPSPYTTESPFHPIYLPPAVISSGRDKTFGLKRSYADEDNDGTVEFGVNSYYSSSVVGLTPGSIGPIYPGLPGFRFPDPYFNVSSVPFANAGPYYMSAAGTVLTKEGGGYGAVIQPDPDGDFRDAAADNISSLDAGF